MIKFFTTKKTWKIIAIALVIIIMFQFIITSSVQATPFQENESIGGSFLTPLCSLLLSLGDGVMNIMQDSIMGSNVGTIQTIDTANGWDKFWATASGAILGVAVLALSVGTGSALATMAPILGSGVVGGSVLLGVGAGAYVRILFCIRKNASKN